MGWQDDAIVTPAAPKQPWENDPVLYQNGPKAAQGVWEHMQAGWQSSATGLIARGKLPDIQLDPQHSKWYERLATGATQMASDLPEMIVGGIGGSAAGTAVAPGIGTVLGSGAGAFALPTAIRETYIQALQSGQADSSGDFLSRAAIVLKHTGKDALVGAATAGLGKYAELGAASFMGGKVMNGAVSAGTARVATDAAKLTTEVGTLVVTPAALEGRLPEKQDFVDAAVLLLGLKGAMHGANKLMDIYAKTGKTPVEVMADAKTDPTIVEDITKGVEEPAKPAGPDPLAEYGPEIPRAYQGLARDVNAREAVPEPSAESGKFVESAFAPIPQAAGEPILPTHLNYNFLNTADDIKGAMSRLSELYEQKMRDATRGTVTWEQTYAEAKALYEQITGEKAPAYGVDNADYAKLAADIFARKQLLISGVERLMELRKAYIAARDAGTATPEMRLEFLAQVDRVAQAQAAARGSQAEVGRALNILKSTNRDKAYYDELERVLNSKLGETGGRVGEGHVDTLMDMLGDMGTPEQALKFAEKASKATTWQKIVEAWKSALVSGPFTQVANILGNVTFEATRPLVDAVAVAINKVTPGSERMSAVEPLARVIGNIQGVVDGSRAAWSTLLTGENGAKLDQHRKAIEGLPGEIIRTPFRLLSAMDAFFRVSNERGEAWALATREASNEGLNPATREFRQRVMEIVTNPSEKLQAQIEAAGQRFTFNMPLGDKGQSVQTTIRKLHMEWAIPFVQTPANIAKEMLRLTPAAPIIGEWRAAIAEGGAARDKAIAEMAMGTAVATAVFSFALSKNISGQGDPDPKKRAGQLSAGWQPYSVKIGDTWYSYQRLQPVGTLLGMAADMAEVWEHMTPDESDKIPKILSTAFANAITNQTFLQGVTNIVNAISDPSRFGPRFVQGLAASLVPGAVGQTAQMMDPYKREVDNVLDAVKARIPGVSETLRPKRDIYGEKVPAADRLGEISPIVASKESTDKARSEVLRLGVGAAKAPDHIQLPSGKDDKLGKVKLTSDQRDIFADAAGHLAHEVITQMVNTPTWDNMPNLAQKNALNRVFEITRKYGEAKAVPPEQIQAEAARIATELTKKLQPKQ